MKTIRLTQGKVALVDDDDFAFLNSFKWHANFGSRNRKWYARRRVRVSERALYGDQKRIYMHTFLLWPVPADKIIDHRNDDGLDNRKENLQFMTQQENMDKVENWKRKKVECSL